MDRMTPNQFSFPSKLLSFIHRQRAFILFSSLLVLYFLPLIINRENSYFPIHDNLDSGVSWRVVLSHDHQGLNFSGNQIVPQIMGGIPRSYMVSDLNFIMLLFRIFNPFSAYLINHILVHIIAFLGMYLFTSRYLVIDKNQNVNHKFVSLGISLAFGILPFYTIYGLSFAGQPLLLFSYLNFINDKEKFSDYLILLLYPFYSFLTLDGVFVIGGLILVFIYYLIVKRRFIRKACYWLAIYVSLAMITEFDLIRSMFFNSNFISQRSEWNLNYLSVPFNKVLVNFINMFLHGQYHASSHQELILVIAIPVMLIVWFKEGWKKNKILSLLIAQIIISLIYGLYNWDRLIPIKNILGVFSSFDWGRLHWLSPFIWYCIFFLSLMAISKYIKAGTVANRLFIGFFLICQLIINSAYDPEIGHYVNKIISLPGFRDENITYRQFFSEDLFLRISDAIGMSQADYRVVSIGIHPSIAQYNGFYTLDSYQPTYPLAYKHKFRNIIAPELAKSKTFQEYFDYWGSRCYLFSSEIPDFLSTKDENRRINHLEIDSQSFRDLGGRYIFSAAEILNYMEQGFIFIGAFEDNVSVWKIYVYEVVP